MSSKFQYEITCPPKNGAKPIKYVYTDLNLFIKEIIEKEGYETLTPKRIREMAQTGRPCKGYSATRSSIEITPAAKQSPLTPDEKILKLTEENSFLKAQNKSLTRESGLFKELAEVIRESPIISEIKPYIKTSNKGKIEESAILLLSDSHADQIIKSEGVQGLENYNFNVACKRAERIVDTTISHLKENLLGYHFDTLFVFGLGDFISGDIHGADKHSQWQNSIKSALGVGELYSHMFQDLSEHFEKIAFISVSGNHPRRSVKKDFRGANDNFDYLVAKTVELRLQKLIDEERMSVIIPDSWSAAVKIRGFNMLLNHGDGVRSFGGIPFYGIERRTRRLTSLGAVVGEVPNYFFYGHNHQATTLTNNLGETFLNGAWNACDEFSYEALAAYSNPTQLLLGVHEQHGVSWRLPIQLRSNDWRAEERKPSRYNIKIV
jgi:hypothetical protein